MISTETESSLASSHPLWCINQQFNTNGVYRFCIEFQPRTITLRWNNRLTGGVIIVLASWTPADLTTMWDPFWQSQHYSTLTVSDCVTVLPSLWCLQVVRGRPLQTSMDPQMRQPEERKTKTFTVLHLFSWLKRLGCILSHTSTKSGQRDYCSSIRQRACLCVF